MAITQNGALMRDDNGYPVMGGTSSTDNRTVVNSALDPITRRLLTDAASGSGTVSSVSVVSANGFAGTVATATTTPAITLTTTVTGILKGNGTAISAATDGTDYLSSTTGITVSQSVAQTLGSTGSRLTKAWMTDLTVTNAIAGSVTGNAATVTTNANLTGVITSVGNATSIASQTGTGTKFVVDTSPTLVTPVLGVATATSINKVAITAPATSSTLTIADGKTFTANDNVTVGTSGLVLGNSGGFIASASKTLTSSNSLTLAGTDSTTMTFPSTSASIARTDAAQTFTGIQTMSQVLTTPSTISVSSNAGTITRSNRINNFTNSSAAAMTITLSTTGATDGDMIMVVILDFSAVAQTITWVNTEDSTVTAPTTSNGSTTLPLTVGFKWNAGTSKWRCLAKA